MRYHVCDLFMDVSYDLSALLWAQNLSLHMYVCGSLFHFDISFFMVLSCSQIPKGRCGLSVKENKTFCRSVVGLGNFWLVIILWLPPKRLKYCIHCHNWQPFLTNQRNCRRARFCKIMCKILYGFENASKRVLFYPCRNSLLLLSFQRLLIR